MKLDDGTIVHKDIDFKDSASSLDSKTKELIRNDESHISIADGALWMTSEEMPLTNRFVNKPGTTLVTSFVMLLLVAGIVVYFEMYKLKQFNNRDYLVWTDPKTWDYDKANLVKQELMAGSGDQNVRL